MGKVTQTLKAALEWHRGDKWRFNHDTERLRAWVRQKERIEQALRLAKAQEKVVEAANLFDSKKLPYEDESGIIRFTLGDYAKFKQAIQKYREAWNG